MSKKLEKALERWRDSGPLEERSQKLLLDLKEASMRGEPQDLIWAAFVRSIPSALERKQNFENLVLTYAFAP